LLQLTSMTVDDLVFSVESPADISQIPSGLTEQLAHVCGEVLFAALDCLRRRV
jgi:hypothetical protein